MSRNPQNAWESHRMLACEVLTMRRDRRYRRGYIQALVSHGIITHAEWEELAAQVDRGEQVINLRLQALPAGWAQP